MLTGLTLQIYKSKRVNEGKPHVVMLLPIRFDINVRLCRVANSHVDFVTPFRSMVLSCQRTPYLINIQLCRRFIGYLIGILALSVVRVGGERY